MKTQFLVKSTKYWYGVAMDQNNSPQDRLEAMKQCFNHVETALGYVIGKSPEAKTIFESVVNGRA